MSALGRIEIFLEVARQQSFAGAAKALGISGPAASKQVIALEEALGVKLLHRTTRLVTLTEEGAAYYERARLAVDELKDAAAQIQDRTTRPTGTLRIAAPLSFGQMHLLPVLSGFAKKYPELMLDIALDDRMVDVMADGFDVVIRVGVPTDSNLITRKLADALLVVAAAPQYLKKHGRPATPNELADHRLIGYSYQGAALEWHYKTPQGKSGSLRANPAFRANTSDMMLQAALDGVGITFLPMFVVAPSLAAGKLVQLFPDYTAHPARQIMALMPPNRFRSAKVKLFLDWLAQACRAMPLTKN